MSGVECYVKYEIVFGYVYLKMKNIMSIKSFNRTFIDYVNYCNISSFK